MIALRLLTSSSGISQTFTAIRDIQARTGKDLGATFLSGTTISNSLTELYVLFKYLRPKALMKQNINCFDAWAAVFTRKTAEFEFNVTNNIIQKETDINVLTNILPLFSKNIRLNNE